MSRGLADGRDGHPFFGIRRRVVVLEHFAVVGRSVGSDALAPSRPLLISKSHDPSFETTTVQKLKANRFRLALLQSFRNWWSGEGDYYIQIYYLK
jgi:hypothetical protein